MKESVFLASRSGSALLKKCVDFGIMDRYNLAALMSNQLKILSYLMRKTRYIPLSLTT